MGVGEREDRRVRVRDRVDGRACGGYSEEWGDGEERVRSTVKGTQ